MNYSPIDAIRSIGRIKTSSVLAPLLAVAIIIGVFASGVTAWIGPDHALTWTLWIAFLGDLVLAGLVYVGWCFVDPDRLQSEEYLNEQQRIRVLTDERHPGRTIEQEPLTANTNIRTIGRPDDR